MFTKRSGYEILEYSKNLLSEECCLCYLFILLWNIVVFASYTTSHS